MYTIGKLAGKFDLSRSTLLYYDSIGLLKASSRTESKYRQYSEDDARRLEQVCKYRLAGLELSEIKRVRDSPDNNLTQALEKRLETFDLVVDRTLNRVDALEAMAHPEHNDAALERLFDRLKVYVDEAITREGASNGNGTT